jgi:hypothetical protein
MSQSEQQQGQQ